MANIFVDVQEHPEAVLGDFSEPNPKKSFSIPGQQNQTIMPFSAQPVRKNLKGNISSSRPLNTILFWNPWKY